MNQQITLYNGATDNKGKDIPLQQAIDTIAGNSLNPFINNIRRNAAIALQLKAKRAEITDADEAKETELKIKQYQQTADDLKKSLPAVTWSGTFSKRAKADLKEYSGLICIDIDKLGSEAVLHELKEKLKKDKYTWLIFTSPSGNGLKVIVQAANGPDAHLQNFVALEHYYKETYAIAIDPSGKDVSRLCFLSADNDFRCNYNSEVFDALQYKLPDPAPVQQVTPLNKQEVKQFSQASDTLEWVKEFTDKKLNYVEGSRNNYIFLFACNANRKGFDISDTLTYVSSFSGDMDTKEVADTIKKAYTYNQAEHGKYKRQVPVKKQRHATKPITDHDTDSNNSLDADRYTGNGVPATKDFDFTPFWKEHIIEKGKGDNKYEVKQLQLLRVAFIQFLQDRGFFIIETGREGYQICHEKNGVIATVDMRKIKNHVYHWCKQQQDRKQFLLVEEMLRKGQKNYFSYTDLESLQVKQPNFLKDTKTEAYFFFENCYVKITADEITTHQISEVQAAIWDTSIIKRDFKLDLIPIDTLQDESGYFRAERTNSDIVKFIIQVSTNPKRVTDVPAEVAGERFLSICSAIGYMLHSYKDPIAKAVLAVDHKIPADKTEQNGGTGKSIIGKSFKYLKGVTELDGKDFKEDYQFRFEAIDIDTKIVVMADCRYNLEFASFFNAITSDFRFNKRHTGYITIPFEDSPKWWFDTNFVFKGEGSSYRRRQHIIEFDDYYSDTYTPVDEFKHLLFTDWDAEQWNMFYNFYFQCVQIYLKGGLIEYKQSNYDSRKLMVESNQEFIDWLDGTDEKAKYKIARNEWLSKKELLKQWNDEAKSLNMTTISPHSFSKWVKKYCQTKGFRFESKKSNSVEYYMIAEKTFKHTDKPIVQELFAGSQVS